RVQPGPPVAPPLAARLHAAALPSPRSRASAASTTLLATSANVALGSGTVSKAPMSTWWPWMRGLPMLPCSSLTPSIRIVWSPPSEVLPWRECPAPKTGKWPGSALSVSRLLNEIDSSISRSAASRISSPAEAMSMQAWSVPSQGGTVSGQSRLICALASGARGAPARVAIPTSSAARLRGMAPPTVCAPILPLSDPARQAAAEAVVPLHRVEDALALGPVLVFGDQALVEQGLERAQALRRIVRSGGSGGRRRSGRARARRRARLRLVTDGGRSWRLRPGPPRGRTARAPGAP